MTDEKIIMFKNRLSRVYRHVGRQARKAGVTCYRVYDHDLPEFPLCIEFYGENLYVAEYRRRHGMSDEEHQQWLDQSMMVITEILGVRDENIFLKLRQRKAGRLGQYQRLDQQLEELVVEENHLRFLVNLTDYLDTGLFLDHRITRGMVQSQAAGKKVLNLFAYTGSFSVYAAAGKAAEVVTVDLSKTYLDWAERNMRLNDFEDGQRYRFDHADVKQYLKNIPSAYYDLIILDPPTFSNSKRMDDFLDVQRDHVELINDCLSGLATEGSIYFSTNFREFKLDEEKINSRKIKNITKATTPFDFDGKLFRYCYLITK